MEIQEYINTLYIEHKYLDDIQKNILNYAKKEKIPFLSPVKVKILSSLIKIKRPEKVLEIGLGSGFSTYSILKSMNGNGELVSIDFNFFRVEYFFENIFKKLDNNLKRCLVVYPLDIFYVVKIYREIEKKFDFIFLDATKKDYLFLLPELENLLNVNGVLLCDNITYSEQTFRSVTDRSKNYLKGIEFLDEFNKRLLKTQSFYTSYIPVEDGMSLSVKIY